MGCSSSLGASVQDELIDHATDPLVRSELVVASLLVGTLLALGHHLFYASLDCQRAATTVENYSFLGRQFSIQQVNAAVGTAFAFLVKASSMLSVFIPYFQTVMLNVGNYAKRGTQLVYLDVMTSALHDLGSLLSFKTWLRRPWLWLLAVVAWYDSEQMPKSVSITNISSSLMSIASIITPSTFFVGVDSPIYMHVPNVDFSSLNLAAPMAAYGPTRLSDGEEPGFDYAYSGPSLTVQRITDAVAALGFIMPVPAPSVNSSWDLDFDGPSLHCDPVSLDFKQAVLENIINYTISQTEGQSPRFACGGSPGYMAWHPGRMKPDDDPIKDYLPFIIDKINLSSDAIYGSGEYVLSHENSHGSGSRDMASVFLAATPNPVTNAHTENADSFTLCHVAGFAEYNETSTVLRCDVHKSTYHATFSFIDGVQNVDINEVTNMTDKPMITIGQVMTYFNSSDQNDTTLQPQPCPSAEMSLNLDETDRSIIACLFNLPVLSTLSYQAVMHAFINIMSGMISIGDLQNVNELSPSTTKLQNTVLALAPELAFLRAKSQRHANLCSSELRCGIKSLSLASSTMQLSRIPPCRSNKLSSSCFKISPPVL